MGMAKQQSDLKRSFLQIYQIDRSIFVDCSWAIWASSKRTQPVTLQLAALPVQMSQVGNQKCLAKCYQKRLQQSKLLKAENKRHHCLSKPRGLLACCIMTFPNTMAIFSIILCNQSEWVRFRSLVQSLTRKADKESATVKDSRRYINLANAI